jgi:hypothetical protein
MNYRCPICGYPNLIAPPKDYMICPSCGTEFGNDDANYDSPAEAYRELRSAWLRRGAPWFSHYTPPPPSWDPYRQLAEAELLGAETRQDANVKTTRG